MSMFLGVILALILVIYSICMGNLAAIKNFFDFPSILITFGGSFLVMLAMSPSVKEYFQHLKSGRLAFKAEAINIEETISVIISLANVSRKEGLLAVEEQSSEINDRFLKKGLLLIIDGTDPELVRSILENDITCIDIRHKKNITFWENLGSMGPAWGMIGTLIGLINMLKNMGSDVSSVGPNMSVALVTTFYGSMLANWICAPMSNKLKEKNDDELLMKEMIIEGLLSIQAGENPRVIQEKLISFLTPDEQVNLVEKAGEEIG